MAKRPKAKPMRALVEPIDIAASRSKKGLGKRLGMVGGTLEAFGVSHNIKPGKIKWKK